jgi:5'-nucleotidase (lipoprotein e(P4) family)
MMPCDREDNMTLRQLWRQTLVPGVVGLLLGVGFTSLLPIKGQLQPALAIAPQAPPPFKAEAPVHRGLDANLYMQTAAEYRACCLQAYNLATSRLRELHAAAKDSEQKLAVIMDLDETVFDNAGFQAMLLRSGLAYDQRLWDLWEEKSALQVGLIPGAGDFIRAAKELPVTVFYISNRSNREGTLKVLNHLEIPIKENKELKLSTGSGDKTGRRKEVEAEYKVLLYLGDNLRDFDEQFRCSVDNNREATRTTDPAKLNAAIAERKDKVDRTRAKWGTQWIILPNPVYGEWTRPLGLGEADMDRLVPTMTKKP